VLTGATVRLMVGSLSDSSRTDQNGVYRFTMVPPGTGYRLRATAPRHAPAEMEGLAVVSDETLRVDVALRPSRPTRGGSISGVVRQTGGAPVRGARVEVLTGGSDGRVTTDRRGRYRLTGLSAGVYTLSVTSGTLATQIVDSVSVRPNHATQIHVELPHPDETEPGAMFGVVRNHEGEPLAGAVLRATDGAAVAEAVADEGGHYMLEGLAVGVYSVTARSQGYVDSSWENIHVLGGHSVRVDFALHRSEVAPTVGSITGTVTDVQAHAIFGALVVVTQGATSRQATTGDHGSYRLPELLPGDYTLSIAKEGYTSATVQGSVTAGHATTLNVHLALLEVPTHGRIIGSVMSAGHAVAGARVELNNGRHTLTGVHGTFELEEVPAGEYTVTISKDGYDAITRTVTVLPDMATHLEVILVPTEGHHHE